MSQTKNTYLVPIQKENRKEAVSDPRAHSSELEHAIDFPVPIGTPIIAGYDGVVVQVKVDSKEGGFENKFNDIKYLNFIILKHSGGEYSEYSHLKHKGACVKEGQRIKAGDIIGYSGNTGYTTAPHLHFHVCTKGTIEDVGKTLEVKFNEKLNIQR